MWQRDASTGILPNMLPFPPPRVMRQVVQPTCNPLCSHALAGNTNGGFLLSTFSLCFCLQTANYVHIAWLEKHKDDMGCANECLVPNYFCVSFLLSLLCCWHHIRSGNLPAHSQDLVCPTGSTQPHHTQPVLSWRILGKWTQSRPSNLLGPVSLSLRSDSIRYTNFYLGYHGPNFWSKWKFLFELFFLQDLLSLSQKLTSEGLL